MYQADMSHGLKERQRQAEQPKKHFEKTATRLNHIALAFSADSLSATEAVCLDDHTCLSSVEVASLCAVVGHAYHRLDPFHQIRRAHVHATR